MDLDTIKRFVLSQREAILIALVFGVMLFASGAFAVQTQLVASGFEQPVFVSTPSGDSRLFIVQQAGAIKVRQPDGAISTFLNLGASGLNLVDASGERGLLGLAFDPNFADSTAAGFRTFYVDYIDRVTKNTVVASFRVSGSDPNSADTSSARTIITVLQPSGLSNHKAGWIGFRPLEPDNLYIATGDGGAVDDPNNRAQNLTDNLGKVLRIDVRGDSFVDPNVNYSVPATNPFVGKDGNDEIWAYGLRNPYRNSFDRLTGNFLIADVGQNAREEIDFEAHTFAGGANYGWRAREGLADNPNVPDPAPAGAVDPVYDYLHGTGSFQGNSITGGYVYRGPITELQGLYFFGDFVRSRIWSIRVDPLTGKLVPGSLKDWTAAFAHPAGVNSISSFGEDALGNLYIVDYGGKLFTLVPEPATWVSLTLGLVLLGWGARRVR